MLSHLYHVTVFTLTTVSSVCVLFMLSMLSSRSCPLIALQSDIQGPEVSARRLGILEEEGG